MKHHISPMSLQMMIRTKFYLLFQVYFLDRFFGYQFSTYGTDVLRISELPIEERVDPMSKVFPKVNITCIYPISVH